MIYGKDKKMTQEKIGWSQMKIMQVLWKKKKATAREITETLNERESIAHSTVQTLIRTLENKGLVEHEIEHRTFIYFPLVKDEKIVKKTMHNVVDYIFNGSVENMVSFVLKNKWITSEEVEEISRMLDEEKE